MKRSSRVAEYHQLRTAHGISLFRQFRGFFDDTAHHPHRIHIDPCAGGTQIDATAHPLRTGERFGDGFHQELIRFCHSFCHKGGITADKVDAERLARLIERFRKPDIIAARRAYDRYRRNGNALVDDSDAVTFFEHRANGHEPFRRARYLVVDLLTAARRVAVDAVEQRQRNRDGAHVEMTVVEHIDSFEYFILGKHLPLLSHSVHRVEQVLVLNVDGNAERGGRRLKLRAEPVERRRVVLGIDEHYHDEIILHDRLRNVLDIDAQLRELARDCGDYARPVPAYDRYYCFHASIISQCYRLRNKCAALFVRYRLLHAQSELAPASNVRRPSES